MNKDDMHSLLRRQMKRCFGDSFTVPEEWKRFIEAVNDAYIENDVDRRMLERSLDLSSQELIQANSEMGAVIKAFPDILFRIAADGTILDYKTGSFYDSMLVSDRYLGKRIQYLSGEIAREKFREAISLVNDTRAMVSVEYPLLLSEKEEYFEARLVPLPGNQIFVVIRNVTKIKEAQEELRNFTQELENIVAERTHELSKANERLKEIDILKTDFLSSVSHEIRTPLTSIIGFTYIIETRLNDVVFPVIDRSDTKVDKAINKLKTDIEIILSEGERLTELINDVLDITKMESGHMEWKMELLSLHKIIEHCLSATDPLFQRKKLNIIKDMRAIRHLLVGDKDRLIQVLINLFSNAVKFTETGYIKIHTKNCGNEIVVAVIDSGIGIKPENQQRIFEKFRQVGDTLTEKPKGTGLGLPICKQIIEHYHGKIWVESEIGKGSSFLFSIPVSSE